MGYKRALVHRMAEKMQELAFDDDTEDIDTNDVYDIISALFAMSKPIDDNLAACAVDIYYCRMGGMYEAFQELPEVLDLMEDEIARYRGFDNIRDYMLGRCDLKKLTDGKDTVYIER